jgi:hypothetical protein
LWPSWPLILEFIPLWSDSILGTILFFFFFFFFFFFWVFAYDLGYDLFWRKSHELLRKMCNLLPWDETLYKCLLSPFHLWYYLVQEYLCDFFIWIFYWWALGCCDPPLLLCLDLSVLLCSELFVLWTWGHQCLVHIYLELFYLLAGLFLLLVRSDLLYLFRLIFAYNLLCLIWG